MDSGKNLNDWLSYSIVPSQLRTVLRPAMWGNRQLILMAELERLCINESVCFRFGAEALWYGPEGAAGEEHLLPAVYDARTDKKYFLYSITPSQTQRRRPGGEGGASRLRRSEWRPEG